MSLIVVCRNVSGLAPTSDYEYEVLVGDGTASSRVIGKGRVEGHQREDGWIALVQRVLNQETGKERDDARIRTAVSRQRPSTRQGRRRPA